SKSGDFRFVLSHNPEQPLRFRPIRFVGDNLILKVRRNLLIRCSRNGEPDPVIAFCCNVPALSRRILALLFSLATVLADANAAVPSSNARPASLATERTHVVLNVRDFGAIGDGTLHRINEWIERGRFKNMRALR